jgi:hypothetical protein
MWALIGPGVNGLGTVTPQHNRALKQLYRQRRVIQVLHQCNRMPKAWLDGGMGWRV